jgi:hypothetical protein
MPLRLPSEADFLEHGFVLSVQHDPKDAVVSYTRSYPEGWELTLTFNGVLDAVSVLLKHNGESVTALTQEGVGNVAFQAWHTDQIIRIYFEPSHLDLDARVHYAPCPRVHFSSIKA